MEESIDACDSQRKLASVQEVGAISAHPDADRLQLATILGWQVVIAKDEVKENERVVYFEIDSKLPGDAGWLPPAIKNRVEKQKHKEWYRVKSTRIRGQLSQGLIVAMDLPEGAAIGDDMTETLGITKHEEQLFSGAMAKVKTAGGNCWKAFPTELISKTEEPRIQSNPWMLRYLKEKPYYATVKLDGTSGTFLIDPKSDEFWACSRNNIRKRPTKENEICPYWAAAINTNLESVLRECAPHLAIQGEICGPNIAKNPLGLGCIDLFVFNIVDLKSRRRLPYEEFLSACAQLGLKSVPVEAIGDSFDKDSIVEVLDAARGYYDSGMVREGLVFRSMDQRISFKAINNDYLCKKK